MRVPQATNNVIPNKGRTDRRYCRFALIDFVKMISCFFVIEFMMLASWINLAASNDVLCEVTPHKTPNRDVIQTDSVSKHYRLVAFKSCRMIGRGGTCRATILNPARAKAEA